VPARMRTATRVLTVVVLLVGHGACGGAATSRDTAREPLRRSAGGNIVAGCVTGYDSTVDYFPEKSAPVASRQFQITYHRHYKVLTVIPREDPTLRVQYALVQCGTPTPPGLDPRRVVQVPTRRLAVTHSDYYGVLDTLQLFDRVVAVGPAREVSTPRLRAALDSGRIVDVGSQQHLDLERLLQLRPDIVLSYWSVSPEWNAPAKVDEVGLKSGALVGHWEPTPLGALDWVKVVALYANREGDANAIVAGGRARYDTLRTLAQRSAGGPRTYITQAPARDIWPLQRADHGSYNRMKDAGLSYAHDALITGADFPSTSLEAALRSGRDAAFWFDVPETWQRTADIGATDARLASFRAARTDQVFAWDRGREAPDRVPYAERWLAHPEEVLADVIAATQPGLLPGHRFHYLRRISAAGTPP
jgi:iron complex transport system substrate-binding protein